MIGCFDGQFPNGIKGRKKLEIYNPYKVEELVLATDDKPLWFNSIGWPGVNKQRMTYVFDPSTISISEKNSNRNYVKILLPKGI